MKTANDVNGQPVTAGPDGPRLARCPECGVLVGLRSRRKHDSDGQTWYWRHETSKVRSSCGQRASPAFKREPVFHDIPALLARKHNKSL